MGLLIPLAFVVAYALLIRYKKRVEAHAAGSWTDLDRKKINAILLGSLTLSLGSCSIVPAEVSMVSHRYGSGVSEPESSHVAYTADAGYRFILSMGVDESTHGASFFHDGHAEHMEVYTAKDIPYLVQFVLGIVAVPLLARIGIKRIAEPRTQAQVPSAV